MSVETPKEIHPPQKKCDGCPWKGPKVGSKGALDAPFVIVGESPGHEEKRKGFPFAHSSGNVLHMLVPQEEAYITNALQCVPPKDDKKAKQLGIATKCCQNRLLEEIGKYPRKIILALGNAALWALTGDFSLKITQCRGKLYSSSLSEHGILAAVHPAALMRGTGSYRQWKQDVLYALDMARGASPREWVKPKFEHIQTSVRAQQVAWLLRKEKYLTGDIETSSLHSQNGRILSFGVSTDGEMVYCFKGEHVRYLKKLLEDPKISWCWHNGKFDIQWFHKIGINARVDDDTILMSYTLDEVAGIHDLETVASDVLSAPDYKFMVQPYLPNKKTSYEVIPEPVLMDYMSIDVGNTARVRSILRKRINADRHCEKLYTKVLLPASEFLSRVESNGIWVDLEKVEDNAKRLTGEIDDLQAQITEVCGFPLNPNSPAQVKQALYDIFKLPNRFGGSTDKDTLKKLPQIPLVVLLQAYRKIRKQYGTYVKSIYKHLSAEGRIHPTFLLHGTVTGRLASRNPNLQNIPRDSTIRAQFAAPPGFVLLECDLSQAELRSLACLSGDPGLVEVYVSGKDLHAEVVAAVFGVEYTNPKHPEYKEKRTLAKNINFGIVYGITPAGLRDQTGYSLDACTEMINAWYRRFPVAADFINKCRQTPSKMQTMYTNFGRQKRVGMVTRENLYGLQNEAANFFHQSTASDITLMTATRINPQLESMGVLVVNLIHDAILMQVPDDETLVHEAAKFVTSEMAKTPLLWNLKRVPFVSDATVGRWWGHLKDIHV